jgi:hypothetical protein
MYLDSTAPNFLADRIRQQAQQEGLTLTPEEEMYVELAGSGRMQEANQALKQLKQTENIGKFGQKLAGLLLRAWEQDEKSDPGAKQKYMQSLQALTGGGHIFKMVMPLMFQHQDDDSSSSAPAYQPPPGAQQVPGAQPESSMKTFVLLVLVALAFLLWWIIRHRL